ncbi:hypothetical protein ACLK1T_04395 [Escherichia coli]
MIAAQATRFLVPVAWKRPERYLKRSQKSTLSAISSPDVQNWVFQGVPRTGHWSRGRTGSCTIINTRYRP